MSLSYGQIRDRALEIIKQQFDAVFALVSGTENPYEPGRYSGVVSAIAQAVVEHFTSNARVTTQSAVVMSSMRAGKVTYTSGDPSTKSITFDKYLHTDEFVVFAQVNPGTAPAGKTAWSTAHDTIGFTLVHSSPPTGGDPDDEVYWFAVTADTPFGKATGSGSVS